MASIGGEDMRDTRKFWEDQYNRASKVSADNGWDWMVKLSKIMLGKLHKKSPAVAPAGQKNQN